MKKSGWLCGNRLREGETNGTLNMKAHTTGFGRNIFNDSEEIVPYLTKTGLPT